MCVTDRHDMTLAVKVALNLNTNNQLFIIMFLNPLPHNPEFLPPSVEKGF